MAKKKEETKKRKYQDSILPKLDRLFPKTKDIVRNLGITKLNQVVEKPDNAAMRGVVAKIPHLLRIVE